jgi:hypothetical protein
LDGFVTKEKYNTKRQECVCVHVTEIVEMDDEELGIQGVSAKTFEPNISVICQRIFMKIKMQIF